MHVPWVHSVEMVLWNHKPARWRQCNHFHNQNTRCKFMASWVCQVTTGFYSKLCVTMVMSLTDPPGRQLQHRWCGHHSRPIESWRNDCAEHLCCGCWIYPYLWHMPLSYSLGHRLSVESAGWWRTGSPVAYFSHKLLPREEQNSTIKKESLVMNWLTVTVFDRFLNCRAWASH